jgi:hypothetical protein
LDARLFRGFGQVLRLEKIIAADPLSGDVQGHAFLKYFENSSEFQPLALRVSSNSLGVRKSIQEIGFILPYDHIPLRAP